MPHLSKKAQRGRDPSISRDFPMRRESRRRAQLETLNNNRSLHQSDSNMFDCTGCGTRMSAYAEVPSQIQENTGNMVQLPDGRLVTEEQYPAEYEKHLKAMEQLNKENAEKALHGHTH